MLTQCSHMGRHRYKGSKAGGPKPDSQSTSTSTTNIATLPSGANTSMDCSLANAQIFRLYGEWDILITSTRDVFLEYTGDSELDLDDGIDDGISLRST
jgi:hypothetical protein